MTKKRGSDFEYDPIQDYILHCVDEAMEHAITDNELAELLACKAYTEAKQPMEAKKAIRKAVDFRGGHYTEHTILIEANLNRLILGSPVEQQRTEISIHDNSPDG